jgi:hypothetical protein
VDVIFASCGIVSVFSSPVYSRVAAGKPAGLVALGFREKLGLRVALGLRDRMAPGAPEPLPSFKSFTVTLLLLIEEISPVRSAFWPCQLPFLASLPLGELSPEQAARPAMRSAAHTAPANSLYTLFIVSDTSVCIGIIAFFTQNIVKNLCTEY